MTIHGYAALASRTCQFDTLTAAGATAIYRKKISGLRADRPQVTRLMIAASNPTWCW
ncbi:hypothetical protein [Bradyrhizobium sp. C9]|uniref:hypothetical protein n=1 Tax=Bradyrhizobium sp. C9 TaxID=142585 RepID=UPI00130465D5|nr:hypothetical protein [Bradyrhizobium sp. C9]